uniref:Putative 30.5 kDa secreted protein 30.5k-1 n=1 Tax=Aedes albopictus TaxID=7160 RepID=Q5MIT5_AEDAL|nr:putative 30.5 kDa secreted protein 30.5k-1 [Aedes albopictus]
MKTFLILSSLATAFVSTALAFDWYAFTQANYASIQTGLAQLNAAATQMNQSIIQQQNRVQNGMDNLDNFIRQSLIALWIQNPNLNLTGDQLQSTLNSLSKAANYKSAVSYIADDYKQSVTNNVMIPAQSIVQNILNAMTTFYTNQWQSCAQQQASQLLQPRLSVGRLQQCISVAVPYFEMVANTTLSMLDYGKTGASTVLSMLNLCSSSSTNCVSKFLNDLPNLLNNIVNAVSFLSGIPSAIIQPGKPAVQECVTLITADIQQTLQGLVNKTTTCG